MAKKNVETVATEVKPTVTEAQATAKTVRISARKVRYVLALVRGKNVDEALGILKFTPNGATDIVAKVVKSAKANATNNFSLDESKLYIKECYANEGPTLKRIQAASKGRAYRINKRTSHITVVLDTVKA